MSERSWQHRASCEGSYATVAVIIHDGLAVAVVSCEGSYATVAGGNVRCNIVANRL